MKINSGITRILLIVIKAVIILFIVQGCEKEEASIDKSNINFPLGRISKLNDNLTVTKNNEEFSGNIVYDNCGGYWLNFDASGFDNNTEVIIKYTRTAQQTKDFIDTTNLENWLRASYYIDCDNEAIISKAVVITEGLNTNLQKATKIQQYVIANIEFDQTHRKSFDIKASKTLEEKIGTCMNFSRLYVTLCRAAGIPARSIWGIVYGYSENEYDFHHQWAEACDENGKWHVCDFNKRKDFFNNDIEYLDLVYGAEENSSITGFTDWIYLLNDMDYLHNYPVSTTARLGFDMTYDGRPDSMVVEYIIKF